MPQQFNFLKPGVNRSNLILARLAELLASEAFDRNQREALRKFLEIYHMYRRKSPSTSLVIAGGDVYIWEPNLFQPGQSPFVSLGRGRFRAILQTLGQEDRIA